MGDLNAMQVKSISCFFHQILAKPYQTELCLAQLALRTIIQESQPFLSSLTQDKTNKDGKFAMHHASLKRYATNDDFKSDPWNLDTDSSKQGVAFTKQFQGSSFEATREAILKNESISLEKPPSLTKPLHLPTDHAHFKDQFGDMSFNHCTRWLGRTGRGDSFHDDCHPSLVLDVGHLLSKKNIQCMGARDMGDVIPMRFPWIYGHSTKDKEIAKFVKEQRRLETRDQENQSGISHGKLQTIDDNMNSSTLKWDDKNEAELGLSRKEKLYINSFEHERDRNNLKNGLLWRRRWLEQINEITQTSFLSDKMIGDNLQVTIDKCFSGAFGFTLSKWLQKFGDTSNGLKVTLTNIALLWKGIAQPLTNLIKRKPCGSRGWDVGFWINHPKLFPKLLNKENIQSLIYHLIANAGMVDDCEEIDILQKYLRGEESLGTMRNVSDILVKVVISAWDHLELLIGQWNIRLKMISNHLCGFVHSVPGNPAFENGTKFSQFDSPNKIPIPLANDLEQLGSCVFNALNIIVGGSSSLWAVFISSNNEWDSIEEVRQLIFAC